MAPDGSGGAFIAWQDRRNQSTTGTDIYAQHILRTGVLDPAWPASGLAVVTLSGGQLFPVAVSDGAGGFIVAWEDHRGANADIYAQRISSAGTVVTPWPANGKQLTTSSLEDLSPRIVADAASGAWLAWTRDFGAGDVDPVVQRVLANSNVTLGTGLDLDTHLSVDNNPAIAPDDSGGVFVAWQSNFAGNFDVHLARMVVNGTSPWTQTICNAAFDQTQPFVSDDGNGNAFIAWDDDRGFTVDVYGLRILDNGVRATPWSVNGDTFESSGNDDYVLGLVPDNAGGAYLYAGPCLVYCDTYVLRLTPYGLPATGWSAPGVSLGVSLAGLVAIPDGLGGSISTFIGPIGGISAAGIVAADVAATGGVSFGWTSPTVTLNNLAVGYSSPTLVTDGNGGAIVGWPDLRNGADNDLYAQRVERFGQLGSPEPSIVNIKDVPNDQGGKVRIQWSASYLDAAPNYIVYQYRIWRQTPPAVAQQALAHGATLFDGARAMSSAASNGRVFRTSIQSGQVYYWEQVGSQQAIQSPGYGFTASTNSDSVGASNPRSVFMVEASSGYISHWDSAPDSGYSVDNLPPVAPAPFTATFSPPNGTFASWGANGETDLAGYRLYRGGGLSFTPSPANRIYQGTVPSYHDVTSTAYIYKVCAYDIHGNEGGCSTAQPPGTTDVADEAPKVLSLAPIDPNPAHDGANLRFGLPHGGRLMVAIYDAQGRRVRTVVDAWLPAGYGLARWDGRNEAGDEAGSGIYFARIDAEGQKITRRFVRIE